LLRKELDWLRAERDQMAQQQADLEGDAIGKALEQALAALPAVVAQHLGHGDLSELTDPGRMVQARALLSELVSSITVLPDEAKGGYTCTVTGDVSGVLRLAGDKWAMVSGAGSPGGLSARLTLPQVTFLLSPVRGVPPERLPEAVKSAIRLVRPANLQAVAVGGLEPSEVPLRSPRPRRSANPKAGGLGVRLAPLVVPGLGALPSSPAADV
jgi:hypothetical protein